MIGIFDSGIGGLTIVREVFKQLPDRQLVYFGDTARTPYGNKSADTIIQYALEDTEFLLSQGAKIIVVACNTASAVATDAIKKRYPDVPLFEVITPAVSAAVKRTKNRRIGVIGTRATVQSMIYQKKIEMMHNDCTIISKPCPLFVPLVEENFINDPITKMIARRYLRPLRLQQIDTLILGCTHYPLIKSIIQIKIGKRVSLIDPAEQTVAELKKYIEEHPDIERQPPKNSEHHFFFSDVAPHLKQLAAQWLDTKIQPLLHRLR
ncbi:MAG: glutamate racemase [Patescibacteria group bacterium]|nr:glutamate racemase [Patescibacteria group bacterium]MDD5715838.1 glutamate racemase [Patescibacteria group bacterium]